ncbi:hypothetical protein BH11ARM2_BH11ARM2_25210 [soil metagenome]
MDLTAALLDSWDRQCRIVDSVASLVDEDTRHALPSPDGWPLDHQLAHIQKVRHYWLSQVAPERTANMDDAYSGTWDTPIQDLDKIKSLLKESAVAVREAVQELLENGTGAVGGYDHPVLFLQHMVWHEGWHVGLLFLGLRLAGKEPSEEWEEAHVWGEWRTEG